MNKTTERILSRRQLLSGTVKLSMAGALAIIGGCGKSTSLVCADPDQLTDSENSLRASLQYAETSSIKEQVCAGCGFFKQSKNEPCGTCDLLKGPVNPRGRCDSWSKASSE